MTTLRPAIMEVQNGPWKTKKHMTSSTNREILKKKGDLLPLVGVMLKLLVLGHGRVPLVTSCKSTTLQR